MSSTSRDYRDEGAAKLVKDLAEGFSKQAQIANRNWLALAVLLLISFTVNKEIDGAAVKPLPFGLGDIKASTFDVFFLFVWVALTIHWLSSFAQTQISYKRSFDMMEKLDDSDVQMRFFDTHTIPTLARVGPLALSSLPVSFPRQIRQAYYMILRFTAGIIMFGLPLTGIIISWTSLISNNVGLVWKSIGTLGALITLFAFTVTGSLFVRNMFDVRKNLP